LRFCSECQKPLPEDAHWSRVLHEECYRKRQNEKNRQYRQEHPDKMRGYQKRYRDKNPDKVNAGISEWKQKHPDKVREYQRTSVEKWRKKHPEKAGEYRRRYQQKKEQQ
jgi:hypothetical protein